MLWTLLRYELIIHSQVAFFPKFSNNYINSCLLLIIVYKLKQ
jgi:hypothetical protein